MELREAANFGWVSMPSGFSKSGLSHCGSQRDGPKKIVPAENGGTAPLFFGKLVFRFEFCTWHHLKKFSVINNLDVLRRLI